MQIGMGKAARAAYHLEDVAVVPSRRTRDVDEVSTHWQIDAFRFDIPLVAHPSDAIMSPETAVAVGQLGGLGVLDAEGLWCRYEDPLPVLAEISEKADGSTAFLQKTYAEPVKTELIQERIRQIRESGVTTAVRISPQHTQDLAPHVLSAGVDLLVIQGTIVSAEHVSTVDSALNLKQFIADLDTPVIVGGCADYKTAMHLMRTGAAGVIVGVGADAWSTSDRVLGIRVPMATAIADAAAARRDYLDETGGRYVHVIADGDLTFSGDIAKAIACGADAVMLGEPLSGAHEAPAGGAWWQSVAAHPKLPRGQFAAAAGEPVGSLREVLLGPADSPDGDKNLFGALRRVMAKTGYSDLKEFQKVELVLDLH
ncbi:GuaB3 family IMP dehydrogenase-related protein [Fodinicola acaciae]|uniref:GuaB3 family IMP dehydrogenase-related protein n=1 Tax=Fodinicola acaciae TaxID=2681555 RepID=UPI0013D7038F|nr:GuaB3 family IMP dehydrogenase-related protein [Fodinicola acaciae]